jgi:hypothetical protein
VSEPVTVGTELKVPARCPNDSKPSKAEINWLRSGPWRGAWQQKLLANTPSRF